MRSFIQRHLDPASRLGEVLFGLIMALGFTGAVRLGHDEADNHALFIGIAGCNLAWAIVDGVMYVLAELFERGRKVRLMRSVVAASTEEAALEAIGEEIDGPLMQLTSPEERRQIHRWIHALVQRAEPEMRARIHGEDLLGGVAVSLLIIVSTFPVVVPFLVFRDPDIAVMVSHYVALGLLFLLGIWWARVVGANPWRIGTALTVLGALLVLVTIALGG